MTLPAVTEHEAWDRQLASIDMIRRYYGVARSSVYRWMEDDHFPQPVALLRARCRGRRRVLYQWADVKRYIEKGQP